ncbi:MAG: Mur ligase family protein [Candidatus Saccharimonadia bacterium]
MFRTRLKSIIPLGLFQRVEPFGHLVESIVAQVWMGFPARGTSIIGVTGTDGKTTTSAFISAMLNDAGIKTGLMNTIGYGTPESWQDNYVHMTTVSIWELLRRIKDFKAQEVSWIVIETTSHALAQNRVWGLPYQIAVMTNVTHEHLDYHKTFERYRDAKRKLFKIADRGNLKIGVINAEDGSENLFQSDITVPILYGLKKGDLRVSKIDSQPTETSFDLNFNVGHSGSRRLYNDESARVTIHLPGEFNVYNALAAAAVGDVLGLSGDQIAHGLASLASVEGRMNRIDEGQSFTVLVDFAHTPDSFSKLLPELARTTKGKLIVLFGSAGRRDEQKRAIQGEIAGKWADTVILTEEDNRDIPGESILEDMAAGAKKAGKVIDKDLFLIPDRTTAIEYAMQIAGPKDVVILLGKGHEKTIERADGEHPWDETQTARKAIRKLSSAS